jgi:hypothetical protein
MTLWSGLCDIKSSLQSGEISEFNGKWDEKLWPNTPGPFYGADTDSCGTGPIEAATNSCLDEQGFEYIFKQPASLKELNELVQAAKVNVLCGYGADGNSHWTLSLIREWWNRRTELMQLCYGSRYLSEKAARSIDQFARVYHQNAKYRLHYVKTELASYLGAYSFFIEEGRPPEDPDIIPAYTW